MLLGILRPGDVTGLMSILGGATMPESAEARTNLLVVFMPLPADWRAEILSWDEEQDNKRPGGSAQSAAVSYRMPDSPNAQ
jgi:hypothetical protein